MGPEGLLITGALRAGGETEALGKHWTLPAAEPSSISTNRHAPAHAHAHAQLRQHTQAPAVPPSPRTSLPTAGLPKASVFAHWLLIGREQAHAGRSVTRAGPFWVLVLSLRSSSPEEC